MKLTEVLLANKDSPPSRVDPPAGDESIVMRALRHLLDKKEKIIKRVKLGDGKTKAFYLTHVIINNGPRSPHLIFTDSRGQQSIINIVPHMDDIWTLVPDEKLKGRWNMTRIEAHHAVSEMQTVDDDLPFDFEIALRTLQKGERQLYLRDTMFEHSLKLISQITIQGDNNFVFRLTDPSYHYGQRDITYTRNNLKHMHLEEEDGKLVLVYNDEYEAD